VQTGTTERRLEWETTMAEALPDPYRIGMDFPVLPIPRDPAACVTVEAGPIDLVVESRDLVDDARRTRPDAEVDPDALQFNDFGASLHVVGRDDGAEHLRFDCFEEQPHYHYIRIAEGRNTIVRLDDAAEGDPIEWTVGRLRTRLPAMLRHAGADELADALDASAAATAAAVDEVKRLLLEAQARAVARRAGTQTAAS
jgi:hypothetical protein